MRRPYFPFFIFAMLFTLTLPFSFDIATSVVPGWHTTILTPHFLTTVAISIIMLIVTYAYWKLAKQIDKISLTLFLIHLVLTIPTVLFIRAPFLFLNIDGTDLNVLNRQVTFATALVVTSFTLFVVGQIVFTIYFWKTRQLKNRRT